MKGDDQLPLTTPDKESTYYTTAEEIHDFETLNSETAQIIRRPILISVSLFGTINTVLTILLIIFTQSWYNGIVFVTYTTLDIVLGIIASYGVFVNED